MKIAINALPLEIKRAGVARYLANILERLGKLYPEHEYLLYFRTQVPQDAFLERPCFTKRVLSPLPLLSKGVAWENTVLPAALSRDRPDLFFSPANTLPFWQNGGKKVVTIHDLSQEVDPGAYSPPTRLRLRFFCKLAARKADRIITVSRFSKEEIVKRYGVPEEKVRVIYESCADLFRPETTGKEDEADAAIRKRIGIGKRFILYVGTLYNRRNLLELIQAFKEAFPSIPHHQLILVGDNQLHPHVNVKEYISRLGMEGRILYLGYLADDREIRVLYRTAEAFIYLSSYEGFGLPVLEAMACGLPVITSKGSSLSEVAGEAALSVDTHHLEEIGKALIAIAQDADLRQRLIQRGRERAKKFCWEKAARETLEVFEEAGGAWSRGWRRCS